MKILAAYLFTTLSAFAIEAEDIPKYIAAPSDYSYSGTGAVQGLYKMSKDVHTARWTQWVQSWKPGGGFQEEAVTRRMIEGGLLLETNRAEDPSRIRMVEITAATKEGWRRTTAFKEADKWVIVFRWEGIAIRHGWLNWRVTAEVDGWGAEGHSRPGKLFRLVHERVDRNGWPILTYSEPIGDKVDTGMIYYSQSGVSPPN